MTQLKTPVIALALGVLSTPGWAQPPNASQAQELANCAGAVAAVGNLDVVAFPAGAEGEWAPVMARILEALNAQPGVEGITGRYAASAARGHWLEQPRAEQERAANECRRRYRS
jgi:hypothetical protein